MTHRDVAGKTFVVVGLARSGCAAGALLRRHGARVIGVDDADDGRVAARWAAEGLTEDAPKSFDEILTGTQWSISERGTSGVILSPGVRPDHPKLVALPPEIEIMGELEIASRFFRGTLLAITGTNGKSTTTELVAHLARAAGLQAEALGNVGRPLALRADSLGPDSLAVVEVSSFQLETIRTFEPRVGVVLNLAPDHLDRYETLAEYYAAKQRLVDALPADGHFITWTRCPEARDWPRRCALTLFGNHDEGASVYVQDDRLWIPDGSQTRQLVEVSQIAMRSALNLRNSTAAVASLLPLDLDPDALAAGLGSFRGLAHRQQVVARRGDLVFINDSKATNVDAARAALEDYPGRVVLIAGGSGKGEDYRPLREVMQSVVKVILIGAEGPAIGEAIAGAVDTEFVVEFDAAVARAAELAEPDGVVMLSPACASFDMFRNYNERGKAFLEAAVAAGATAEERS